MAENGANRFVKTDFNELVNILGRGSQVVHFIIEMQGNIDHSMAESGLQKRLAILRVVINLE